eukprot:424221-Rhodomonas_salina.1
MPLRVAPTRISVLTRRYRAARGLTRGRWGGGQREHGGEREGGDCGADEGGRAVRAADGHGGRGRGPRPLPLAPHEGRRWSPPSPPPPTQPLPLLTVWMALLGHSVDCCAGARGAVTGRAGAGKVLSLIHISEPTRPRLI